MNEGDRIQLALTSFLIPREAPISLGFQLTEQYKERLVWISPYHLKYVHIIQTISYRSPVVL